MLKYELLMVASEATYTYSKGNRQIQKVPTVFALKLRALYITLSHYIYFFLSCSSGYVWNMRAPHGTQVFNVPWLKTSNPPAEALAGTTSSLWIPWLDGLQPHTWIVPALSNLRPVWPFLWRGRVKFIEIQDANIMDFPWFSQAHGREIHIQDPFHAMRCSACVFVFLITRWRLTVFYSLLLREQATLPGVQTVTVLKALQALQGLAANTRNTARCIMLHYCASCRHVVFDFCLAIELNSWVFKHVDADTADLMESLGKLQHLCCEMYCEEPGHKVRSESDMLAANATFARIGSRISFDMLKSLRRAGVFLLSKT